MLELKRASGRMLSDMVIKSEEENEGEGKTRTRSCDPSANV